MLGLKATCRGVMVDQDVWWWGVGLELSTVLIGLEDRYIVQSSACDMPSDLNETVPTPRV